MAILSKKLLTTIPKLTTAQARTLQREIDAQRLRLKKKVSAQEKRQATKNVQEKNDHEALARVYAKLGLPPTA